MVEKLNLGVISPSDEFSHPMGGYMLWFMILQVVTTLVELVQLGRSSESDKDLEILLLRRQLAIVERKQRQPMRLSRGEKLTLVALA